MRPIPHRLTKGAVLLAHIHARAVCPQAATPPSFPSPLALGRHDGADGVILSSSCFRVALLVLFVAAAAVVAAAVVAAVAVVALLVLFVAAVVVVAAAAVVGAAVVVVVCQRVDWDRHAGRVRGRRHVPHVRTNDRTPPFNSAKKMWRRFIFTCSPGTGPSSTWQ